MKAYRVKTRKLAGTKYPEVNRKALKTFNKIKKRTKRRPYVRSAYFNKEKIFLNLFWSHLKDKTNLKDKTRRLKYFPCGIELIQHSKFAPESKKNPNKKSETLYRFKGVTIENEIFFIQIKEGKKGNKYLLSIFPE